jgi:hypothetical protein
MVSNTKKVNMRKDTIGSAIAPTILVSPFNPSVKECQLNETFAMSVRRVALIRLRRQELTDEAIVSSAEQLLLIYEALDDLGLSKYYSLANIRVEHDRTKLHMQDTSTFARYLYLPVSNSDIYVHTVKTDRRQVIAEAYSAASSDIRSEFLQGEYSEEYSLGQAQNMLSLFTYDKQLGEVKDSLKITRFLLENNDTPLARAAIDMMNSSAIIESRDTSSIPARAFIGTLLSMRELVLSHLKEDGFDTTEENIAAYIDYSCILRADGAFMLLTNRIKIALEDEGHCFHDGLAISYRELVNIFMRKGWDSAFLYSLQVNEVPISNIEHIDALHELWITLPSTWYYKYIAKE